MNKNYLNLHKIHYVVNSNIILKDVDLTVEKGEFISIIGKSGSGKTTLLKIISGLIKQTSGEISLNNKILANNDSFVEPENRKLGLVVQELSLIHI